MINRLANTGLATQLVFGMVVLILITTLSAGAPAYLLTRSQLNQQVQDRIAATAGATDSLYLAAQNRLVDLTRLLAERPTLRRLVADGDETALAAYLRAFQEQSDLDLIVLCGRDGSVFDLTGHEIACSQSSLNGFELIEGRPALIGGEPIPDEAGRESPGSVMTGVWLDGEFLSQLSEATGVEQRVLSRDGSMLSSAAFGDRPAGTGEQPYLTAQLPLADRNGDARLIAELALPIADLVRTERRALGILVASTGMIVLLGVILGIWTISRLTAPLRELTRVAEQISQGNLVTAIPALPGPVEIATLSATLKKSQDAMMTALEERSQARDWLNSLVQSIVEGVVTFDTRGRVTLFSQGAETITGRPAPEVVGRPVDEVFPLVDPHGETFLDRIPPAGDKREIEVIARSGKHVVLAITGARLIPPNSDTVQVALVLRDVTEEQALRNLRSFFLANISHEFRTPLSTLNASIELLMDQANELSPAEVRELLKPTYLSLVSLQTLIDNLLESSSIEAGSFVIRPQKIGLNEVIANALSITRPLIERRRQTVVVTEPAYPVQLVADPARLTQALVNLLNNASKYGPPEQPIDLCLEPREGALRLSVADRGPGIPAEDRVNLFRRFVRLHAEGREQYGIGLGLYLVKRIAEAHGGTVGVEDRPEGGTIFWMELRTETGEANHESAGS